MTDTDTTTVADRIAAVYGDGQTFVTGGEYIIDTMTEARWRAYSRRDQTIHIFDDGSMIVDAGDMWDILTVDEGRLIDSNGGDWGAADEDGEPSSEDGWRYGACRY
jgi:hypothetical protein